MKSKNIFIVLVLVVASMMIVSATYNYRTQYNPWTQKLDFHITSNMSGENVTADYYSGQPIDGSINSGIIQSDENVEGCGCINVTYNEALEVTYPSTIHRIHNVNELDSIYCSIPAGSINVSDNRHSIYYIDDNCTIQSTTFETFFNMDISPGEYSRFFDVYAIDGAIEEIKGASLMAASERKSRRYHVETDHLKISSGIDFSEGTFPGYDLSSGKYTYINSVLNTDAKNTTENNRLVVWAEKSHRKIG